jgi:hypothetical protein
MSLPDEPSDQPRRLAGISGGAAWWCSGRQGIQTVCTRSAVETAFRLAASALARAGTVTGGGGGRFGVQLAPAMKAVTM